MAPDAGAQIGDRVWLDANGNGIQDPAEVGMAGITVTLHLSGTGAISTTVTNASGIYTFTTFTYVVTGTYSLEFARPSGYVFSPPDQGGDEALDSDVDPITGFTPGFPVTEGVVADTWDAGLAVRVAPDKFYLPLILCTTELNNGNFEQQAQGWSLIDQGLPSSVIGQSTDLSVPLGRYSALLGRPDYPCNMSGVPLGYAAVEQTYYVPPVRWPVVLRFKYIVWSQDASTSDAYDRFEVYVTPQGGAATRVFADGNQVSQGLGCNVWRRVPGPENPRNGQTAGWAEATVDLSPYKGQTVTFSFRNYSRYDGWYNTYTYLDDVRVVFDN